jgi:hypothetical protein
LEINLLLLENIEKVLGPSSRKAGSNYAFHCPFCNHHKKKLEVQVYTNDKGENPWACWVCNTRGKTIRSLLRQLKVSPESQKQVLQHISKGKSLDSKVDIGLTLPKEFISLKNASTSSVELNRVRKYLAARGIFNEEIIKYNIGYCSSGSYANRVIFPSYDENGLLNFFVGRTVGNSSGQKYKNPSVSRDITVFENMINYQAPIILVEGIFDALAVKRNAVPILGKVPSQHLYQELSKSTSTKSIYIALDNDALDGALNIAERLIGLGKKVYLIQLSGKDPSDLGFEAFTKEVELAKPLDFSTILKLKMGF